MSIDITSFVDESVAFAGSNIVIKQHARVDAGVTLCDDVTVGIGAWIKKDSVVRWSVPANAIVEGNPAVVVGYALGRCSDNKPVGVSRVFTKEDLKNCQPGDRLSLGIDECFLQLLINYEDHRGALSALEFGSDLIFKPKRSFIVHSVPNSELRGEHAHWQCEQFLTCVSGSCRILLDNGTSRCEVVMDNPKLAIYMPAMVWGTQYLYSRDAALLVFASEIYDGGDYIRDYAEFLQARKKDVGEIS